MSSILRAKKAPPFTWWYAWLTRDEDGIPKWTIEEGLRQPDTTRIKFYTNETGVNSRGRIREISADIVPDKGLYGPEYAMIFTIPQFRDKVITRLDPADPKFVSQLFTLFGQCLQGLAASKWTAVLVNHPVPGRTAESF